MTWNAAAIQEYESMLTGKILNAIEFDRAIIPDAIGITRVMNVLEQLENGEFDQVFVEPVHNEYLDNDETTYLHAKRVACVLWADRKGIFPWRLADRPLGQLQELLGYRYQGLVWHEGGYRFHMVWDVNPGMRTVDSAGWYALVTLLSLLGLVNEADIPSTDEEMIYYLIQKMRDDGWRHMIGYYNEYTGYTNHGLRSGWDYETLTEVKRTGCHTISQYLVSLLRSYNIPAHTGPGWDSLPLPEDHNDYCEYLHQNEHCYIHFSSIGKWFYHGDNLYDYLLMAIPLEFSFRDEVWIRDIFFDLSQYEFLRIATYEKYFLWVFCMGEGETWFSDVRYLYHTDQLRNILETAHEFLASKVGAPAVVPPIFTPEEVDGLIEWVTKKIAQEEYA